jgi:hypothetical protein
MTRTVKQTIAEMRSAVELSRQLGTPVADHQLILDWADQLEATFAAEPPGCDCYTPSDDVEEHAQDCTWRQAKISA